MKRYQHIFFDWDHTLWDFEANSAQAMEKLYYAFDFRQFGILSPQHFVDIYQPINYQLWKAFREGEIDAQTVKIKRFQEALKVFSVYDQTLISEIKSYYLNELPKPGILMPSVRECLDQLSAKYQLHCVTNGFLEVTQQKLKHSQLHHYFDTILSAEEVGVLKPHPKIFAEALRRAEATVEQSLFIGDNLIADIQGAQNMGIDQVFYNPKQVEHKGKPTYEIAHFDELLGLLQ